MFLCGLTCPFNDFLLLLFRAFGLYKENAQVDPEREHIKRTVLQEYKQKLKIHENIIPDPIDLKSGLMNEKKWNEKMAKIMFSDISRFYSFILRKDNLIHRLECEYKPGKAYRYFTISQILSPENEMCTIPACQHETIRWLGGLS